MLLGKVHEGVPAVNVESAAGGQPHFVFFSDVNGDYEAAALLLAGKGNRFQLAAVPHGQPFETADPSIALGVVFHVQDEGFLEELRSRQRAEHSIFHHLHSFFRSHPNLAGGLFQDRVDHHPLFFGFVVEKGFIVQSEDTIGIGADPDGAGAVLENAVLIGRAETFLLWKGKQLRSIQSLQTAVRSDPQPVLVIHLHGLHPQIGELSVELLQDFEFSAIVDGQATGNADPQLPIQVKSQGLYAAPQAVRQAPQGLETRPIEGAQPLFCSYPDRSIGGQSCCMDGITGQAFATVVVQKALAVVFEEAIGVSVNQQLVSGIEEHVPQAGEKHAFGLTETVKVKSIVAAHPCTIVGHPQVSF